MSPTSSSNSNDRGLDDASNGSPDEDRGPGAGPAELQCPEAYEFGPFHLNASDKYLLRTGEFIRLPLKCFEVLLVLVRNARRIVSGDELMREVWPNTFVEKSNLTQSIFTLRKILGEDNAGRQYIVTAPRRGYRLAAEVRAIGEASAGISQVVPDSSAFRTARSSSDTTSTLAVLPLVNEGPDQEADYLADGITESLIRSLSQVSQLHVMARSTVFRYKGQEFDLLDVGGTLGVGAILTGRVLRVEDRIVISMELIDAATGWHIWGARYDRERANILEVQEEIARAVSEQLQLKLTGEERRLLAKQYTENTEAYRLYLKGRYFWNRRMEADLEKGIEFFQRALDLDPTYALAYAGLADCFVMLGNYDLLPPREAYPRGKAAALRALELDHTLAEAHSTLAFINHVYDWDWQAAEKAFKLAIELNPHYPTVHQWYAHLLALAGRFDEAFAEGRRALELDHLSLIINASVARNYYFAREYEKATELCHALLELEPGYVVAHQILGLCLLSQKQYKEAISEFQMIFSQIGENASLMSLLGYTFAACGEKGNARAILDRLQAMSQTAYVPAFNFGLVHLGLGDLEQVFAFFEKACEERSDSLLQMNTQAQFDPLRSDPRFRELLLRIGLSPEDVG
jgi:TolB-like protein/Flp pilus assembly protein TadD